MNASRGYRLTRSCSTDCIVSSSAARVHRMTTKYTQVRTHTQIYTYIYVHTHKQNTTTAIALNVCCSVATASAFPIPVRYFCAWNHFWNTVLNILPWTYFCTDLNFLSPTRMISRSVLSFANDSPCGVWYRGLTIRFLCFGPIFGSLILNEWMYMNLVFVSYVWFILLRQHDLLLYKYLTFSMFYFNFPNDLEVKQSTFYFMRLEHRHTIIVMLYEVVSRSMCQWLSQYQWSNPEWY